MEVGYRGNRTPCDFLNLDSRRRANGKSERQGAALSRKGFRNNYGKQNKDSFCQCGSKNRRSRMRDNADIAGGCFNGTGMLVRSNGKC
jgi:hypothetical protein